MSRRYFFVFLALNRPRKLLLFVNPYGGKKNALKLYEKYAKPIFLLANIDVSVVITQRSNQIFDLVLQQHLDHFDGIVCCGGDGSFSELFNGLIYRDILSEHSDPSKVEVNRHHCVLPSWND
jgi:ceramide kinase